MLFLWENFYSLISCLESNCFAGWGTFKVRNYFLRKNEILTNEYLNERKIESI